jgi:DsbC/DsbD-like thiol-disulfide interchange protein
MHTPKILLPLLLTLAALPLAPHRATAVAGAWESNPQSRVQLITPWNVAPKDGELRLGVHFTLAPGWHVYWKNSGDAGFPPVVVFGKTPGLSGAELLWPAPQRFELRGGLVAFGYETEVVYPVRATLTNAPGAPGDRVHLSADVDYLVCEVDCVPHRYTLTADQPLSAFPVPDPVTKPLLDTWWSRLPVTADRLPGVTTDGVLEAAPGGAPFLEVRVRGARPIAGVAPGLFLETHDTFDAGRPEAKTTEDGVVFRVPLKPREAGKPLPKETTFAWTVTGIGSSLEAKRTVPLATATTATAATMDTVLSRLIRPVPGALLAVVATFAALWLWGLLGSGGSGSGREGREALGFAAAAVLFGTLWGMSREVSFVGLAWIELILLAMALCAWLRRRAPRRRALSFILTVGLAACAVAAPWLAHHNRLTPVPTNLQPDPKS